MLEEGLLLLEIANDSGLKSTFQTTTLPVFWIKAEFPKKKISTAENPASQ